MLSNYVLQTTLDSMASNLNGAIANCIAFQKELLEQLLTENEELKAKLETANCEIQELYTSDKMMPINLTSSIAGIIETMRKLGCYENSFLIMI